MKIEPFISFDNLRPNPIFHLRSGMFIGGVTIEHLITNGWYPWSIEGIGNVSDKGEQYIGQESATDIIGVSYDNNLTTNESNK